MKTLRDYQVEGAVKGCEILKEFGLCYLAYEVRLGKTSTALEICRLIGAKEVLFLTKKKAIDSIYDDYIQFGFDKLLRIEICNDESMHKILNPSRFDIIIHDEHHRCVLGSTLIDGVPIMNTAIGDVKKSFNFATGKYEYKRVKNVFKNKLNENLIKIKCNGKEIVCTESHKIFTKRGWIEAGKILPSDELQVV